MNALKALKSKATEVAASKASQVAAKAEGAAMAKLDKYLYNMNNKNDNMKYYIAGGIALVAVVILIIVLSSKPSPIDGGWSAFTECVKPCGPEQKTRQCNNPVPAHGGADCQGNDTEDCGNLDCWGGYPAVWVGGQKTSIKGDAYLPTWEAGTDHHLHKANGPHHKVSSDEDCAKLCMDDPACVGVYRTPGPDHWCKPIYGNPTQLTSNHSWEQGIQLRESPNTYQCPPGHRLREYQDQDGNDAYCYKGKGATSEGCQLPEDAVLPAGWNRGTNESHDSCICSLSQTDWINNQMGDDGIRLTQEQGEERQGCKVPANLQSRIQHTMCDVGKTDWINNQMGNDDSGLTQEQGEERQGCKVPASLQSRIHK